MTSYLHPTAELRPAGESRLGLFTSTPIAPGTLVTLWSGEIHHVDVVPTLAVERQPYFIHVDEEWMLGPPAGPLHPSEYFNHSCEPTCGMLGQIGLVTLRHIIAGEQLTFDYAMAELAAQPWACCCGAPGCRGRVRQDDAFLPELRARYAGFYSPWIQRKLDATAVSEPGL